MALQSRAALCHRQRSVNVASGNDGVAAELGRCSYLTQQHRRLKHWPTGVDHVGFDDLVEERLPGRQAFWVSGCIQTLRRAVTEDELRHRESSLVAADSRRPVGQARKLRSSMNSSRVRRDAVVLTPTH